MAHAGSKWLGDEHCDDILEVCSKTLAKFNPGQIETLGKSMMQQLKVVDERWIDTHPALELAGTVSGIHYQVTWLVDLNAPYRLERHDQAGNSELTTLQEIHVDTAALAAPDSRNYEIIDYADLGDRERDPFVLKVQSHLVGGHWHSH